MKTIPIVYPRQIDKQNAMLHEYIRRDAQKIQNILFITPPKQEIKPLELISEEENEKILKKLKQFNKQFFDI